jgi:hypothetical protein
MPYLLIRHKVADYAKWKPIFDEHSALRKAGGSRGGQLFCNADNPNETLMLFEWDNLEKARKFAQSENLRQVMQQAGVADKPDIYFLEDVEQVSI